MNSNKSIFNIFSNESVDNILHNVIKDDSISIEKFRQICLISGTLPQNFFITI